MKVSGIARMRLSNQRIVGSSAGTVQGLVSWMGALQAQDFEMSKWAVGLRLPGSVRSDVEAAVASGEILRTHLLRPTWHLVSAGDIRWMLDLTGPRIKAAVAPRHEQLGITGSQVAKSCKILEKSLAGGRTLGRKELIAALEKGGVAMADSRASHIFLRAEIEGVICSGAGRGRETGYALLEERAPRAAGPSREEALSRLARQYFASRGPATPEDFAWWSGLKLGDARGALAAIEGELEQAEVDSRRYWFAPPADAAASRERTVRLLPAFDEYIIAYADRSAAITIEDRAKAVSDNGIFRPTIVVNGEAAGIWSRVPDKGGIVLKRELFKRLGAEAMRAMAEEAERYRRFCEGP
jgi:hypothetical protein